MTTQSEDKQKRMTFPRIGLRSFKTALSTTLCAVLYVLIGRNATFACIGAVFGMESANEHPLRSGGNRLMGTIIGGFLGIFLFTIQLKIDGKFDEIILLLIGILLLILVCQLTKTPGAIQAGAVVFYIVMLNTPVNSYVSYALNRMIDTAIGVSMSICINLLLSKKNLSHFFKNIHE